MSQKVNYLADLGDVSIQLNDKGKPVSWVHALPGGQYQHPVYGELDFNDGRIQNFSDSVTKKVRKTDPDIDYDHKQDPSKGNKAAGWVTASETRPSSDGARKDLWLLVEWTPQGAQSVRDKEFRYFSSEIADEWEDNEGNKHKDVLLGGGITNRPYMKQLVPLNLSELTFKESFDQGEQVDPKELRRKLGLSETATDAEVDAKIASLNEAAAKLGDPKPPTTALADQLKALGLSEDNPLVKNVLSTLEAQNKTLAEMQVNLRLSETTRQLAELTNSPKVALTAAVLNDARDIMVGAPKVLSDKVFSMLKSITDGTGVQELGERANTNPDSPRGDSVSAVSTFNTKVEALMAQDKLDYGTAVERVAFSDPNLYNQYRGEVYIKE